MRRSKRGIALGRFALAQDGAAAEEAEYCGVCFDLSDRGALLGALCALLPLPDGGGGRA